MMYVGAEGDVLQGKTLKARGAVMDMSPEAFGFLRSSIDIVDDVEALRARMTEDGYLFLPGLLNREQVIAGRRTILERAATEGILDQEFPVADGILKKGVNPYFRPQYTQENSDLLRVVYDGSMIAFFDRFFGEPTRHFDYTWLRAVGPGPGTSPHCDIVYMGRGTFNLVTAWTPFGDIPLTVGGLMLLENSHCRRDLTSDYLQQDVDSYCQNGPNATLIREGNMHWEHWRNWRTKGADWDGAISNNPVALRQEFGGRWLTCPEYRMGDVLLFSMATVHGSIDNQTQVLRLSTDTRYQPASEPVDERWIGDKPIAHGITAKRTKIC
jgi:hypothetical protein